MSAGWLLTTFIIAAAFSYLGTLALGVPAHSFCRARDLTAPWVGGLAGFVIGDIVWLVFAVLFPLSLGQGFEGVKVGFENPTLLASLVWPAGVLGAVSGVAYWMIAGRNKL